MKKVTSFAGLVLAMCAWPTMAINGAGGGLETLIQKAQGDGRGGGDVVIKVARESSGYRIDFSVSLAAVRTAAEGNNLGPQAQTLPSTQGEVYVLTNPETLAGATVQLFCLPAANQTLTTPGVPVATGMIVRGKVSVSFNGDCKNSDLEDLNEKLFAMNAVITLQNGNVAWFGIGDCNKPNTLGLYQACSMAKAPLIAFHKNAAGLTGDDREVIGRVFK